MGERIGSVSTGLSDETIISKLKTRTYATFATNINLEELAPMDQEPDSCIICQVVKSAYNLASVSLLKWTSFLLFSFRARL